MSGGDHGGEEKDQDATPERLRRAREDGEVARSAELSSAAALIGGAMALAVLLPQLAEGFVRACRASMGAIATSRGNPDELGELWALCAGPAAWALLGLLGALGACGALGAFVQVGPLFTLKPLRPSFAKLNPTAGLKRMFASADAWLGLLRSFLKLIVIAWICWTTLASSRVELERAFLSGFLPLIEASTSVLGLLLFRACAGLVVLGIGDYLLQRWQFRKRLKMSQSEVQRESREEDGDPHQKAARRQMHQELLEHSVLESLRSADVLVVNPTHIACALRYRPSESGAPRVVARGDGQLAARMRATAREAGIPIVRDIPLARALFRLEDGAEIPEALYEAAIEVLRWVEQVARAEGWTPAWSAGEGLEKPAERATPDAES